MKFKGTKPLIIALAFFVVVCFSAAPLVVDAASKTTKIVTNQKQLNAAMKDKNVKTIKIKSNSKKTFKIVKSKYKTKKIFFKACNATLKNCGNVKSITVNYGKKVVQKGSAKDVTINARGTDVSCEAGSDTGLLTVDGNGTDIDLNEKASVDSVAVEGDDATVHIDEGSDVDKVAITGEYARVQDDESTNIVAKEGVVAVVDESATDTEVDLKGDGMYSSVVNRTDESIDLEVKKEKVDLPAGEVYSMADSTATDDSPLSDDNPLRRFSDMVKCGNICLEIHGCGAFADMSSNDRVHGWYHNLSTGSDYECFFVINGSNIKVERVENTNFEKNYIGDAEFSVVSQDDDGITLVSGNNVYGDQGTEYTLIYPNSSYQSVPGQEPVCSDNPLRIFKGGTNVDNGLWLEIHGTGVFANMSSGNSIHGWYHNTNTGTDYECRFVVEGNRIDVKHIENAGCEKNFLGEASFEIVLANSTSLVLKSTTDTYGDDGVQYTFASFDSETDDSSEIVTTDNPFLIFSGRVDGGNGLDLEIHGKGQFAHLSKNKDVHGWYHNKNTGTDYECRFKISGNSVTVYRLNNPYNEKNFLGNATFEIIHYDSTSLTLKSTSDIYGDNGTEYTFRTKSDDPADKPSTVNPNNPLAIFGSMVESGKNLNLEIHGNGVFSSYSNGDSIHGWYHNTKTGTDYECWFVVDGTSVTASRTYNPTYERNYMGDATFEIMNSSKTSVTLKSTSDIYGDEGTEYTFSNN